jgi:lipopolysaccharide transport system permease protein
MSSTAELLCDDAGSTCRDASGQVEGAKAEAGPPRTVIERRRGGQVVDLGELWRYRELLFFLTWRDIKVRYKQTVLGAAWAILQPLMMLVVFIVVFSRMARVSSGDVPYPLFALAGLLPWMFFSTAIVSAGGSVIGSERLITKIYFPRLLIPFAAIAAAVVDFVVSLVLLLAMMAYYGVAPGAGLLLAPPVFALILVAGLGIGTLLSALNVSFRDFKYVVPFLTQFWMFATPTIYMEPGASSRYVLYINPMAALVDSFRAAMLGGAIPWGPLASASTVSVASLLIGCLYFRNVERSFADVI